MTMLYDGNDYLEIDIMNDGNGAPDYTQDFLELGKLKYDDEHQAYLVPDIQYVADQINDWENHEGDYQDGEDERFATWWVIDGGTMWAKGLLEQSGYFRSNVKEEPCWTWAYASQGVAYYIDKDNCKWAVKPHEKEGWLWTAWKAEGGTWTEWHEERAGA